MSHTLKVISLGLALLAICLVVGRLTGGNSPSAQVARASLAFIPLWAVGAAINMWIGVAKAGYTVVEEAPVFALVFGAPAVIAVGVWWLSSR
jgi:hypothetical protein